MKKLEKQSENFRLGAAVWCRTFAHRSLSATCPSELRGIPVVVGDDSAELALAADLPTACGRKLASSTLLPISLP
jgi:hypothetical protein